MTKKMTMQRAYDQWQDAKHYYAGKLFALDRAFREQRGIAEAIAAKDAAAKSEREAFNIYAEQVAAFTDEPAAGLYTTMEAGPAAVRRAARSGASPVYGQPASRDALLGA